VFHAYVINVVIIFGFLCTPYTFVDVQLFRQAGSTSAEPTLLLPGEQEALQQSAAAGSKMSSKSTSRSTDQPTAMSTPASLKTSKKQQAQPVC